MGDSLHGFVLFSEKNESFCYLQNEIDPVDGVEYGSVRCPLKGSDEGHMDAAALTAALNAEGGAKLADKYMFNFSRDTQHIKDKRNRNLKASRTPVRIDSGMAPGYHAACRRRDNLFGMHYHRGGEFYCSSLADNTTFTLTRQDVTSRKHPTFEIGHGIHERTHTVCGVEDSLLQCRKLCANPLGCAHDDDESAFSIFEVNRRADGQYDISNPWHGFDAA